MRHKHGYRKLGRNMAQRQAMLRSLATSLIKHESINTTLHRAKEVRSIVEKMITLGKKGSLHNRRQAASYLYEGEAVSKIFTDLAKRFEQRPGGYTRILKRGVRFGDGAKLATLELVDSTAKTTEAAKK